MLILLEKQPLQTQNIAVQGNFKLHTSFYWCCIVKRFFDVGMPTSPTTNLVSESDLSSKKHWAWVEEYVRVENFAYESHAEQVQAGTKGVGNKTTKKSCRCLKRFCLSFKTFLIYQVFGRRSLPPLSKLIHSGNGICSCLKHAINLWWLLKRLRKAIKLTDIINTDKVLQ